MLKRTLHIFSPKLLILCALACMLFSMQTAAAQELNCQVEVNIDQIQRVENEGREATIWLFNCSQPLPVSRGFRDNIKEVLDVEP